MLKLTINIIIAVWLCAAAVAKEVPLDDPAIKVTGAKYTHITDDGMEFLRFSPQVLSMGNKSGFNTAKGKVTTCVTLNFTTDSKDVQLSFNFKPGDHIRHGDFIVKQNSKYYKKFRITPKSKQVTLDLRSVNPDKPVNYSVIMPMFANPILTGITIDDYGKITETAERKKKVYVALGDSITHGTGQDNSTQTYAWKLAGKLNMELFNLAVGGGKISVPAAKDLKDWKEIDLITVLIGFNDLHFEGKTVKQYCDQYNEMLDAIRVNHPRTRLFCISPLYTRKTVSEKTGITIQEFRDVVEQTIKTRRSKGDKNIFLIAGDKITSEKNLRGQAAPTDPVHLGIEGASLFADQLHKEINRR